MKSKLKTILILLNSALVLVGLYYGAPIFVGVDLQANTLTAEKVNEIAEKTTDIQKLRKIVKADADVIRTRDELLSLVRYAAVVVSGVAIVIGFTNIAIIDFSSKKKGAGVS